MQSAVTELHTIMAWDLVCQNCSPLSCARAELIQCTCLGIERSSLGSSSSGLFPTGLRCLKKMDCLPSLLSRPPPMSPDLRIEVISQEHPR